MYRTWIISILILTCLILILLPFNGAQAFSKIKNGEIPVQPKGDATPVPVIGQETFEDGKTVGVRLDSKDSTLHINPPWSRNNPMQLSNSTITVEYLRLGTTVDFGDEYKNIPCLNFPIGAESAFSAAKDIWAGQITSSIPIKIEACWANLDQTFLALSKTVHFNCNDFNESTAKGSCYPLPLMNTLNDNDNDLNNPDLRILFNANFENDYYFGIDPNANTPPTQINFETLVLHEITHGLGYVGTMRVVENDGFWGSLSSHKPYIYDIFTQDASNNILWNTYPSPSQSLKSILASENVYFNGTNAIKANCDERIKLYAPDPWEEGSSYSNLDGKAYDGTINALMTFSLSRGESILNPGPGTLGILKDIGWVINPPITYAINGRVKDKKTGIGVAGVDITLNFGQTITTDSKGDYILCGLPIDKYIIKPSLKNLKGSIITPDQTVIPLLTKSTNLPDFEVIPIPPDAIIGRVIDIGKDITDKNGVPVPASKYGVEGITITASNGISTKTDINGEYLLTPIIGKVNIIPSKTGYTFDPPIISAVSPDPSEQNFKASCIACTYFISGQVTNKNGIGVENVDIELNNGKKAITDKYGNYILRGLPVKQLTYTVTPKTSLPGVTFDPPISLPLTVPPRKVQDFKMNTIGCPNIIKNGGFEDDTDWYLPITKFPANMKNPIGNDLELMEAATAAYTTDEFHTGSRSLRTGIIDPAKNIYSYSSGWQQVTIPANATKADLRFWAFPRSMNGIDGIDVQLMLILDSNKQEISRPVQMRSDERTWKLFGMDMLPLAGQTVWIYFGTYNNGWNGNMSMYIDDVSLEVCQ